MARGRSHRRARDRQRRRRASPPRCRRSGRGRASLVATKTTLQANNSSKAQGGIQAALGDDDTPELHAEDVMRSSHETAEPGARRGADVRGARGDRLARGARLRRSRGRTADTASRAAAARRASGCCRSATGPATRSRRLCAKASRRDGRRARAPPLTALEPPANGVARDVRDAGRRRRRSRRRRRARLGRTLLRRGGDAAASSRRTTRTRPARRRGSRCEAGAEARDLDALQYHPNGGAWPSTMQGYSIPETTRAYGAVLLNAEGEEFTDSLGPRDAVSQAIFDEVDAGRGVDDRGRAAGGVARHDADRRGRRGGLAPVHAPPLPRCRHRPARRADPHLPRAPLPERRPRDRTPAETTLEGLFACGEIAGGTHGRNRMMGN